MQNSGVEFRHSTYYASKNSAVNGERSILHFVPFAYPAVYGI